MSLFFWRKKKPAAAVAPDRHQLDAEKLAEYTAFDEAVGAIPTEDTLRHRFREAVFAGHTQVVEDTLKKGLPAPSILTKALYFQHNRHTSVLKYEPLTVAVNNDWPDMARALVSVVDENNLQKGLAAAEYKKDAPSAKLIRSEMEERAAPPRQTLKI